MSNFEKQQYDFLLKTRKQILAKKNINKKANNISKKIKEIDEEMDYRDYNEEW